MDGAESFRCVCRICRSYDLSLNWNEELDEFIRMTYKDCFYKYTSFPETGGNLLSEFLCEDCATGVKNFHVLVEKSMETFKLCERQFDKVDPSSSGFADEICSTASSRSDNDHISKINCNEHFEVLKTRRKEKCNPTEYSFKSSDENMAGTEDGIIARNEEDLCGHTDDLSPLRDVYFKDIQFNDNSEDGLEGDHQLTNANTMTGDHDFYQTGETFTVTTLGDDSAKQQSDDSDNIHKIECVEFEQNDAILCEETGTRSSTAQMKNEDRLSKGKSDLSNANHILLDFDDKPSSNARKTPVMCSYCSKLIYNVYYLKQHEQTHEENRPRNVSCPTCGLKLLNKHGLYVHMKTHEENRVKRYKCEFCEKAFFNRGACNVHRRIHLGQMVQCPLCPKEFYRQIELDKHMPRHSHETISSRNQSKQKKYYVHCKECDKKIASTRYNAHRAAHMNDPFMRCNLCEKDFFNRQSGGRHMARVHQRKRGDYDDITFYYQSKDRPRLSFLLKQQQEDMEPVE